MLRKLALCIVLLWLFQISVSGQTDIAAPAQKSATTQQQSIASQVCSTTTFLMRLRAGAGEQLELANVEPLRSGQYFAAGTLTLSNSSSRGLLMMVDNEGTVVKQQTFLVNNRPVSIRASTTLENGELLVTGAFTDVKNEIFLARLQADFTLVWQKTIGLVQPLIKLVISTFDDDRIALAAQVPGAILHSTYLGDGSLIWSKRLTPAVINEVIGYTQIAGDKLGLIFNSVTATTSLVQIASINKNNGSLASSSHLFGNSIDVRAAGATWFNNRMMIAGMKRTAAGTSAYRTIAYGDATNEYVDDYTYGAPLHFSYSGAINRDGSAAGYFNAVDQKLYLLAQYAGSNTRAEPAREIQVSNGAQLMSISSSYDMGYLFGLNSADRSEIIFVKTDSIGILANCTSNKISISNKQTALVLNSSTTAVNSDEISSPILGSPSFGAISLAPSFDCKQNYCPLKPVEPACLNTYVKSIGTYGQEHVLSQSLMQNNRQILITATDFRLTGALSEVRHELKLLDDKSEYIKSVGIYSGAKNIPVRGFRLSPTRLAVVSNPETFTGHIVALMDDNLNLLWSRTIRTGPEFSSGGTIGPIDVHMDAEGNIYCIGTKMGFSSEKGQVAIYKLDPNGNELWSKIYEVNTITLMTACLTSTSKDVIVVVEGNEGYSFRFDKQTGNLLNSFRFAKNFTGAWYVRFLKYVDGKIFYSGSDGNSKWTVMMFDTTAAPVRMRVLPDYWGGAQADAMDHHMYCMYGATGDNLRVLKLDTLLNPVYAKEIDLGSWIGMQDMSLTTNGYLYASLTRFPYLARPQPYIMKMDTAGIVGSCGVTDVTETFVDVTPTYTAITCTLIPSNYPVIPFDFHTESTSSKFDTDALVCVSTSNCSSIDITQPAAVCKTNTDVQILYSRNAGCTEEPLWRYDKTAASLKSSKNGVAVFQFLKSGVIQLSAELRGGCATTVDKIDVSVQANLAAIDLGNDTTLCPGDSLTVSATAGYQQYQWQDGSTASVFKIKQSGKYTVTVTNACGETQTDEITVVIPPTPVLYTDKNVEGCANDGIPLHAEAGFSQYQWRSQGSLSGSGQSVSIKSNANVPVYLQAVSGNGCVVKDTIDISVRIPKTIDLGPNKSICANESVSLDAGIGYLSYEWNTNEKGQSITAIAGKEYSIRALDPNGCYADDTIQIGSFPLPAVNLGVDRDICINQPLQLDGGNYKSWLWNDGSTTRYKPASAIGTYEVRVTDQNNCVNSDAIEIKKILPSPANFLVESDSICRYGKLTILPTQRFTSWNWSTGERTSSITINKAGSYELTVTDANGCVGTEKIEVYSKDCLMGVYIPNAFTPNRDGKNDEFKALVYGPTASFSLKIYNRWGQVIFTSTDPEKGWNGSVSGKEPEPGNYVWLCQYQFDGQEKKVLKGYVLLVR